MTPATRASLALGLQGGCERGPWAFSASIEKSMRLARSATPKKNAIVPYTVPMRGPSTYLHTGIPRATSNQHVSGRGEKSLSRQLNHLLCRQSQPDGTSSFVQRGVYFVLSVSEETSRVLRRVLQLHQGSPTPRVHFLLRLTPDRIPARRRDKSTAWRLFSPPLFHV